MWLHNFWSLACMMGVVPLFHYFKLSGVCKYPTSSSLWTLHTQRNHLNSRQNQIFWGLSIQSAVRVSLYPPYLGSFKKCTISILTQTHWVKIYIFNKILRWFVQSLKFEKHCSNEEILLPVLKSFPLKHLIKVIVLIVSKALKKINVSTQPAWIICERILDCFCFVLAR